MKRGFDRITALHAYIFKPARLAWYYFSTECVRGLDSGRFRYLLFVILEQSVERNLGLEYLTSGAGREAECPVITPSEVADLEVC
jgi:hypothetical protein